MLVFPQLLNFVLDFRGDMTKCVLENVFDIPKTVFSVSTPQQWFLQTFFLVFNDVASF